MDEVETELMNLAHAAYQLAGERTEAKLVAQYGQYAPELETKVRKLRAQPDPHKIEGRAWLQIPRGATRSEAIVGSMRLNSTEEFLEPKTKKALKFEVGGETVFAKKVRRPSKVDQGPFVSITNQFPGELARAIRELDR